MGKSVPLASPVTQTPAHSSEALDHHARKTHAPTHPPCRMPPCPFPGGNRANPVFTAFSSLGVVWGLGHGLRPWGLSGPQSRLSAISLSPPAYPLPHVGRHLVPPRTPLNHTADTKQAHVNGTQYVIARGKPWLPLPLSARQVWYVLKSNNTVLYTSTRHITSCQPTYPLPHVGRHLVADLHAQHQRVRVQLGQPVGQR